MEQKHGITKRKARKHMPGPRSDSISGQQSTCRTRKLISKTLQKGTSEKGRRILPLLKVFGLKPAFICDAQSAFCKNNSIFLAAAQKNSSDSRAGLLGAKISIFKEGIVGNAIEEKDKQVATVNAQRSMFETSLRRRTHKRPWYQRKRSFP